jgi:hypothetical protein
MFGLDKQARNFRPRFGLKRRPIEEAVMARHIISGALVFAGLAAAAAAPSLAAPQGGSAARALIERQLSAFQRGDAQDAFDVTGPELKANFATSGNFMDAVRANYTPFFHHRVTEFGLFAQAGDEAAQGLTLVDDDDNVWSVVYKLGRQPNGAWLIDGVLLVKDDLTDL